jgi:hypothetical protein
MVPIDKTPSPTAMSSTPPADERSELGGHPGPKRERVAEERPGCAVGRRAMGAWAISGPPSWSAWSRSDPAQPGRDECWGHGGHFGAPSWSAWSRSAPAQPGRGECWGYGGHFGAPSWRAWSRSDPAQPGRDERWGHGGHLGAPIQINRSGWGTRTGRRRTRDSGRRRSRARCRRCSSRCCPTAGGRTDSRPAATSTPSRGRRPGGPW